jgi:hypothetical protein
MRRYVAVVAPPPHASHTQRGRVWAAVAETGADGATRDDVVRRTGLPPARCGFLLSELKREGKVQPKPEMPDVACMPPRQAALFALAVLEDALVAKARVGTTPDMDRAFVKYQKIKALALRGVGGEADVALRMALLELVRLVF